MEVGSSSKIVAEYDSTPTTFHGNLIAAYRKDCIKPLEVRLPNTVINDDAVEIRCFSEDLHIAKLDFQIIRLQKQIYVWIGCNSGKFGSLYAATTTRPNNGPSVTSLRDGSADCIGSTMAARLVKKTGLSIILACNIPKGSPELEATAEKYLIEKLRIAGYIGPVDQGASDASSLVN